jgi:hypothetical protein
MSSLGLIGNIKLPIGKIKMFQKMMFSTKQIII